MPEFDTPPTLTDGRITLIAQSCSADLTAYAVESPDGEHVGRVTLEHLGHELGRLGWAIEESHRRRGYATGAIRLLIDYAFEQLGFKRLEAEADPANKDAIRVATRSGMHREGVRRMVPKVTAAGGSPEASGLVVLARLATDPPVTEPAGFRALLNSFLPRKRAIGQMFIRDTQGRVLLCELTYKRDWDLPGGVVEVGESPRLAVTREVEEELALQIEAGRLLLTDWLPPWGGWEDALCLVFDGGTHDPSILEDIVKQPREIAGAHWCTIQQVREHCADFTTRRIEAVLRGIDDGVVGYTESGRG